MNIFIYLYYMCAQIWVWSWLYLDQSVEKKKKYMVIEALYLDPEDLKQSKSEEERDCVYLQLLYVICKFLHGLVVMQLETFCFVSCM